MTRGSRPGLPVLVQPYPACHHHYLNITTRVIREVNSPAPSLTAPLPTCRLQTLKHFSSMSLSSIREVNLLTCYTPATPPSITEYRVLVYLHQFSLSSSSYNYSSLLERLISDLLQACYTECWYTCTISYSPRVITTTRVY